MFSSHVANQLGHYVYRLIDPRNGETFYVGKGIGNRVFSHARGELLADADALTSKLARIRAIRLDGFDVAHAIHRHGLSANEADEVEAALIDAYPEATNMVGGKSSRERGLMHSTQIVERYEAKEAQFRHSAVVISVNQSVLERENVYSAVRYAWKIDPHKAARSELVLAVQRGLIVGVFVADRWLAATVENFPGTSTSREGRWGFEGREASEQMQKLYLRKRLPGKLRKRGAANPVRYVKREA